MPNQPTERDRTSYRPHARPRRAGEGVGSASRRGGRRSLGTPASVVVVAGGLLAFALALTGLFAMPDRRPDNVAAAGATSVPPGVATPAPVEPTQPGASLVAAGSPSIQPAPTPSPSATPEIGDPLAGVPSGRLQRAVDAFRKKTGIPGISVAIAWDDGRAWAGASGMADVASREPMTTGTALAFASVSKTFTAAVVLQLIDEGKVALDESAAHYLPEYGLDPRITVRMLMDHRSSLPDFFANVKIDRALQADKEARWSPRRTWKYVPKRRRVPGTIYDYSNTNYLLLGELVQNVTGNRLATEIRDRLLDPLQLTTAWYQVAEKPLAKGATGYRLYRTATGSTVKPVSGTSAVMPFRSVVSAASGAGSIAGTATDAARWMQAFASGRVVRPETYHAMIADSAYTKAMRAKVTYGLGVQVITIEHQETLGHSGRYLGFQNTVRYLPGPGISIAILTNQNTWDPAILMRRLIRIVAPAPSSSRASRGGALP